MSKKDGFRSFLILWFGQLISGTGSGLTTFGLGVYVYMQTGRTSYLALIAFAGFLPGLLITPLSGVLADRFDRRVMMIFGDSMSILGLLYILFQLSFGELAIWELCLGVGFNSLFSSFLEPAYRSTITDMLTEEQYSKASGLVQIAGASKFILSPLAAGYLLHISTIQIVLLIDMGTFFITVLTTSIIRQHLLSNRHVVIPCDGSVEKHHKAVSLAEFKKGWQAIKEKEGVLALVMMTSGVTFFVGFMQILTNPMILSFADSKILGISQTLSACGMLIAGVVLSMKNLKGNRATLLSRSLFLSGGFMVVFGMQENIVLITIAGLFFFATLPVVNACLDYLIRVNIDNEVQGRVWGLIGFISQGGYLISYLFSGLFADRVFEPLMQDGGAFASLLGPLIGTGQGRGIALLIMVSGIFLSVLALRLNTQKSLKRLDPLFMLDSSSTKD